MVVGCRVWVAGWTINFRMQISNCRIKTAARPSFDLLTMTGSGVDLTYNFLTAFYFFINVNNKISSFTKQR